MREPLITVPASGVFHRRTGVCLNMIVRDEAPVIERLLRSTRAAIDYFVIVDTGSTDGTPELIQRLSAELDLPGEIHFRQWVNFGHNRQQALALALAADRGDWLLFIDADEELVCPDPGFFERLEPGATYKLEKHQGTGRYALPNLVDVRHTQWQWRAPVHEYLKFLGGSQRRILSKEAWILYREGQGGRSRGVSKRDKYLRDVTLLEAALAEDPEDPRSRFYLAQSYRDAGEHRLAYENYDRRTRMAGWDQETYMAHYEKGRLAILLALGDEVIVSELLKAHEMRPMRAEPLWLLARFSRFRGLCVEGYRIALMGLKIPLPADTLFVDKAVYDWRLLEEFALCAHILGRHQDAAQAVERILRGGLYPSEEWERLHALLSAARGADATQRLLRDGLRRIQVRERTDITPGP